MSFHSLLRSFAAIDKAWFCPSPCCGAVISCKPHVCKLCTLIFLSCCISGEACCPPACLFTYLGCLHPQRPLFLAQVPARCISGSLPLAASNPWIPQARSLLSEHRTIQSNFSVAAVTRACLGHSFLSLSLERQTSYSTFCVHSLRIFFLLSFVPFFPFSCCLKVKPPSVLQGEEVLLVWGSFSGHVTFSPIPPSCWVASALSCSWAKFTKEL